MQEGFEVDGVSLVVLLDGFGKAGKVDKILALSWKVCRGKPCPDLENTQVPEPRREESCCPGIPH